MKRQNLNQRGRNSLMVDFLEWNSSSFGDVEIPTHLYVPTSIKELESLRYDYMMHVIDLPFLTNYNFIMEVVDKIEKTAMHVIFEIANGYVHIKFYISQENRYWEQTLSYNDETTKIMALNDICIDFIIFYNETIKYGKYANK